MIELDAAGPAVTPRDAATVVLLRDEPEGFAVYMVRRHAKSGFMAGAYVFPGGTLDPGDLAPELLARATGRDASEAARRLGEADAQRALGLHVAAVRETFEEAGILLGDVPPEVDLPAARARVLSGISLAALAAELSLALRLDALVPFSRWVTPVVERRRYDARFFLARAPHAQRAEHDRVEVTDGEWLTPRGALDAFTAGRISLPPPTLRTLEQLARFESVAAAIAHAERNVPCIIQPELRQIGDLIALTLPGDPEHSEPGPAIEGPTRFVLIDGVFRSAEP